MFPAILSQTTVYCGVAGLVTTASWGSTPSPAHIGADAVAAVAVHTFY